MSEETNINKHKDGPIIALRQNSINKFMDLVDV
jgi:hypothetical protein